MGTSLRLPEDFSAKLCKPEENGLIYSECLKKKNCQPRTVCMANCPFKKEGKIKTFPEKEKLREFITTRHAL